MGFSKPKRDFPPSWRRSCQRGKSSRSPSTVAQWRNSALPLQIPPSPNGALPADQIFGWRMTSTIRSKRLPLSTAHHYPPGSTPSPGSCSLLFCNCSTPKSCSTSLTAHPYNPCLAGPRDSSRGPDLVGRAVGASQTTGEFASLLFPETPQENRLPALHLFAVERASPLHAHETLARFQYGCLVPRRSTSTLRNSSWSH